jgi:hypothetical protein
LRRLLLGFIVISATFFSTCAAERVDANPTDIAGIDSAVLKADQQLQLAIRDKDAKAVGILLDHEFTWTNEVGETRKNMQFLKDSSADVGSDTKYSDVKVREYGQMAIVTGTGVSQGHTSVFFARIWVKRPAGWLLLTHQYTTILPKDAPSPQLPPLGIGATPDPSCENPCHKIPYTPKTATQGEVAKAYQAVETAVTVHDAPTWAYYVADEFVGIGRRYMGKPDAKQERVDQIAGSKAPVSLPKMLWGQVFVFGDSAIMIADHLPVGERPYHVIRVWVNRDGRWQLFHRQETTIEQPTGAS